MLARAAFTFSNRLPSVPQVGASGHDGESIVNIQGFPGGVKSLDKLSRDAKAVSARRLSGALR